MSENFRDREKKLLNALDWLIFLIATVLLIVFIMLYFAIPNIQTLSSEVRGFVQALLVNLIPIPLLFVVSYAVFRRIQTIRSEHDRDLFIDNFAKNLAGELAFREGRQVLLDAPSKERDASLEAAKELWLIGVALNRIVHKNFSLLRNKLRQGNKIKVLLVKPESNSVSLVAKRKIDNVDPMAMRHYIELTLATLCGLKQEFSDYLDIRVIDYPISFGVVAVDIESQKGRVYIEYYSFKTEKEGLHLALDSKDKPWYDCFGEQIKELWAASEKWTCDIVKVESEAQRASR